MKYLSLFSGIGGFELALNKVFLNPECIGFSEINKNAIKIYKNHFPNHKELGDIKNININNLPDFDLLVGSSPCQDLSSANIMNKGLEGDKSILFYNYLEILNKKNPKYFLFENVASMKEKNILKISNLLKVEPINLDSAYFSAQRRKRLYWCNWEISMPSKKSNLVLKDILENNIDPNYCLKDYLKFQYLLLREGQNWRDLPNDNIEKIKILKRREGKKAGGQSGFWKLYNKNEKSPTITASGMKQNMTRFVLLDNDINLPRYPTPIEFERLQTFPDNYTLGISDNQRYKVLGNSITVDVIIYILKFLKKELI